MHSLVQSPYRILSFRYFRNYLIAYYKSLIWNIRNSQSYVGCSDIVVILKPTVRRSNKKILKEGFVNRKTIAVTVPRRKSVPLSPANFFSSLYPK
jgi:hypothetical protein